MTATNAVFIIEKRMGEARLFGDDLFTNLQGYAGVCLPAVPITPITGQFQERGGDLRASRLQLLQTDNFRRLLFDPLQQLLITSANAVDVPSSDFQEARLILC